MGGAVVSGKGRGKQLTREGPARRLGEDLVDG
jgi:hypothetical protein